MRYGMARVVNGSHRFTRTTTRLSTTGRNRAVRPLPFLICLPRKNGRLSWIYIGLPCHSWGSGRRRWTFPVDCWGGRIGRPWRRTESRRRRHRTATWDQAAQLAHRHLSARTYTRQRMQASVYGNNNNNNNNNRLFRDNPGRPVPEETLCLLP